MGIKTSMPAIAYKSEGTRREKGHVRGEAMMTVTAMAMVTMATMMVTAMVKSGAWRRWGKVCMCA
jgi:hypothetical protein